MDYPIISIVGAGNVVENRLIPALLWAGFDQNNIKIYGLDSDKTSIEARTASGVAKFPVLRHSLDKLPNAVGKAEGIVWLATPPFSARKNFLKILDGRSFIVEKPLGLTREDFLFLEKNFFLLKNCFVLSYYFMEKFAPFFWMTGALPVPSLLLSQNFVTLSADMLVPSVNYSDIETVEVSLSEPYSRQSGDSVSSWQKDFGLLEFSVHAGAALSNLGLDYKLVHRSNTLIKYSSDKGSALVERPSETSRSIVLQTKHGLYKADGINRSASFSSKQGSATYSINPDAPLYSSVVAYALDYINNKSSIPNGDLSAQLTALKITAS